MLSIVSFLFLIILSFIRGQQRVKREQSDKGEKVLWKQEKEKISKRSIDPL